MKITTSKKFRVNLRDILQGLIVAAGTPVLFIIQKALEAYANTLKFEFPSWQTLGMAAVGGGVTYLIKKFFTPSKVLIKAEPPAIVEVTTKDGTDTERVTGN